jgi:hypothetical protein
MKRVPYVLAASGVVAAYGAFQGWRNLDAVGSPAAVGLATLAPFLCLFAALRIRRRPPRPPAAARLAFVVAVLTWLGFLAFAGEFHRVRVEVAIALGLGAYAALLPFVGRGTSPAEIALFNLCLLVVLAEVALRAVAWISPSPLFSTTSGGVRARIAAHAFEPRQVHLGFPCNSRGFYDEEFLPPERRERPAVAVIGDSFSASAVPHSFHYTTVCERELSDVDVLNVGWASMGPDEYLELLIREVLPLRPDAVVVALYLGNDLDEVRAWNVLDRILAAAFDRGGVLLFEVPRRLRALARERGRAGGFPAEGERVATAEELRAHFPWIEDVAREPGTFSEEAYLRKLVQKARGFGRPSEERGGLAALLARKRWEAFASRLLEIRDRAAPTPFAAMLIPDEAMVEDGLWRRVEAEAGERLDRHGLRERLVAFCGEHGIPCLDAWPALRAAPAEPDGDRHLYKLRDTHWNVRGNEVAGKALAPFVRSILDGAAKAR